MAATPYSRYRDKICQALTAGGVTFIVRNPRARRGYVDIEFEQAAPNLKLAEEILIAVDAPGWKGIASAIMSGKLGSQSIGSLSICARKKVQAAASSDDPVELVAAFVTESAQIQWTNGMGPETLPSGPRLLALDKAGKARAAAAAYRSLPPKPVAGSSVESHLATRGTRAMLGSLAARFLRADLPIPDADLATMVEHAAAADASITDSLDFDRVLVVFLARRRGAPAPPIQAALHKLIAKRGAGRSAADRRVCDACANLLER